MGGTFSRWIYGDREIRILMSGLDAAGKTTMLYKLKLGEVVTTIPTIGFNVETIDVDGVKITAWDIGLRSKSRPLLRHYYPNTQAVIYVVDSLDQERMDEVKELLYYMINEDELRGVPLLVMANKQDNPKACTPEKIADALGLRDLRNRPWHIVPCSATNGTGVYEGLQWLVGVITGNMVKTDVTQSLTTSVKDVTETTSQIQQKAGLANLGFFYKGLEFLQGLTGCKAKKQLTVVRNTVP